MASEIDEYLDQIEQTETHINHLVNLLGRMYESWKILNKLVLYASRNISPELGASIVSEINKHENLMQELKEMVEVLISDRVNMLRSVAALILWAQKTMFGK